MKKSRAGFTLVEVTVVVSIIAILSTVGYANFSDARKQSRDAKRQADLTLVQGALELYKQENGRYPEGCNDDASIAGPGDGWSGELGIKDDDGEYTGAHKCSSDSTQYIIGLAPKYIKVLPKDPRPSSGDYGYVYRTNADGTVYKFVARKSVESKVYNSYEHEFAACDVVGATTNVGVAGSCPLDYSTPKQGNYCGSGICNVFYDETPPAGHKRPSIDCRQANIETSLAVWGGYANPADVADIVSTEEKIERGTEKILCDMP